MEPAPLRQTPPLLHNRYRVTVKLGITRLAVVYRATDERLQRSVLVHLLRPEHQGQAALRERFLEEARGRARRPHPALLEVYDSAEVGLRPYLVTEDVQGKELREMLPLAPAEAMRILRQIVGAVIACQDSGVPTPPITSNSILIGDDGRPLLVEPWWLSAQELTLHVAHYRAPERSRGSPPGPATVVYNLGLLAYELFTGSRPFKGDVAKVVALQHLEQELPPMIGVVRGFAPRLAQVLAAATAREPADRLPDLAALARELAAVEAQADNPTQPMLTQPRPLRQAMRESLRPVTGVLRRPSQRLPAPPPPVYTPPPPPPVAAAPPQARPVDFQKEVQKEAGRERRRRGCRRTALGFALRLAVVLVLLGGVYWAYNYGMTWFEGGGARSACSRSLPDFVCERFPSGGGYVVESDLNLRSTPNIAPDNVVGVLIAGTRVEQSGDPRVTDTITWVPVRAELDGRQVEGWVSFDYLRKAE